MTLHETSADVAEALSSTPSTSQEMPTPGELESDIRARLGAQGLFFPNRVVEMVAVSLLLGKHLLFVGPPGTGKTALAEQVAAAGVQFRLCPGYTFATGSSDWTPAETVGAYGIDPESAGQLVFEPGQVLEAIKTSRWLILDELNRADIDRALGPLFTVLSGQATTLPHRVKTEAGHWVPISIVPESAPPPPGHEVIRVPRNWRMLATMNLVDRDVLFDVSHALLRRFAYIEVGVPERPEYQALLARHATGDPLLDSLVAKLGGLKSVELGPAITLDVARYVKERLAAAPSAERVEIFQEAIRLYVEPQLSGLRPHLVGDARAELTDLSNKRDLPGTDDTNDIDDPIGADQAPQRGENGPSIEPIGESSPDTSIVEDGQ